MPRSRSDLTAGEWAVLALLAEEPSHGFAIARVMAPAGEVGRVWAVRRPLVYRAAETLTRMDLVRPTGTEASRTGPQRTVLAATPAGKRAVTRWLKTPVEHVRDGRSLLMLKLLFLARRGADATPLLTAQRDVFAVRAALLARAPTRPRGSSVRSRSGGSRRRLRRRASWRPCSPSRCRPPMRRAGPPSTEPPRAARLRAVPELQECRR